MGCAGMKRRLGAGHHAAQNGFRQSRRHLPRDLASDAAAGRARHGLVSLSLIEG